MKQQELAHIAGEEAKWYINFRKHLVVYNKTKHNPTPWYLPKRAKILFLCKKLTCMFLTSLLIIVNFGSNQVV